MKSTIRTLLPAPEDNHKVDCDICSCDSCNCPCGMPVVLDVLNEYLWLDHQPLKIKDIAIFISAMCPNLPQLPCKHTIYLLAECLDPKDPAFAKKCFKVVGKEACLEEKYIDRKIKVVVITKHPSKELCQQATADSQASGKMPDNVSLWEKNHSQVAIRAVKEDMHQFFATHGKDPWPPAQGISIWHIQCYLPPNKVQLIAAAKVKKAKEEAKAKEKK